MFDPRIMTVVRRAAGGPASAATDAALVERFADTHDETAFTELVARHGPAVWALCRRLLRSEPDAEDAFQATFLVLAGRAGRVRKAASIGSWLHGVAFRLSHEVRQRPPLDPQRVSQPDPPPDPADSLTWAEVRAALDEELAHLPDNLRAPLLLCYYRGLTQDEAAAELGWKPRTIKARIARGRNILRRRLTRRGVDLPAALTAPLLAAGLSAGVPRRVVAGLITAAVNVADRLPPGSGVSAAAVQFASQGMTTMTTVRNIAIAVSAMALVTAGAVFGLRGDLPSGPPAADPAAKPTEFNGLAITGTVRFHGEPVAGAVVRPVVYAGDKETPANVPSAVTDARGRFVLPQSTNPRRRREELVARDPQGRIGWLDRLPVEPAFEPAVRIDLLDVADAPGRLTDATGAPISGATVRSQNVSPGGDGKRSHSYKASGISDETTTAVTDADGRFRLKGVPVGAGIFAELNVPGFGKPQMSWKQDAPCDLKLEKAGAIAIRFEGAADPAKLAGLTLTPSRKPEPGKPAIRIFDRTKIVASGRADLTVTGIVPGRYTLQPSSDWNCPYLADPSPEFTIPPGRVGEVVVKVRLAAEVRGRVVDAKTGAGVAADSVGISSPRGREGGREVVTTVRPGADGRFRAFMRPGDLSVVLFDGQATHGYLPPPADRAAGHGVVVAAGQSHTFPDIVLEPAVPVDGVVVDTAGRPVPGVAVFAAHDILGSAPPIITDAAGRFRLTDLGADDVTALRTRTPTATTAGSIAVSTKDLNGPVKLVVAEANACRLRGRVVDAAGKPVADAMVGVGWQLHGVGRSAEYGTDSDGGAVVTTADGRFETLALWPGDDYVVGASAEGFGKAETTRVRGVAGQVHDIGTIVLPAVGGEVAGTVVDAAGKPVGGVRVSNDGDGPQPIAMLTGPDGRFRLSGLYSGPAFVIARKDGHRFTAMRTAAGEKNLRIVLLAAGAVPPVQPDPRPAAYVAAEAKLARHLLDRMWALPRDKLGGYDRRVLEGMARLDLDQARHWLDEWRNRGEPRTGDFSGLANVLRLAKARQAAATDTDETIGLLAPIGADEASRTLLDPSRRISTSDRVRAQRLAEEAAVRARTLKLPDRAWALASIGELVVQLGRRDAGQKLIVEAADLAEAMGTQEMQGFARGSVAAALAPFDLARAEKLIPLEPVRESNRWRVAMADRLAATDLPAAFRVLDGYRPDNSYYLSQARRQMALRLVAAGRAAEAVKIADSIPESKYRVTALADIAVALAKSDPALARSLIDRAADYLSDHQEEFRSWDSMYGGPSGIAAWLAFRARMAGHPDVASIVARALACRITMYRESPGRVAEMQAKTAIALALADPVTAKAVLDRAVPPGQPVPGDLVARRDWIFAVALADPERAIAEIDRQIDRAKTSPEGLQRTSLVELLITLTQPTEADMVRELNKWASLPGGRDGD
jgi:RNA polymerase sigma factor (sigma-70 family)